jgi:hypothetical protein
LRALCARRDDLLEMIVAEENRLEHAPRRLQRETRGHIDYLRKHHQSRTLRIPEKLRKLTAFAAFTRFEGHWKICGSYRRPNNESLSGPEYHAVLRQPACRCEGDAS